MIAWDKTLIFIQPAQRNVRIGYGDQLAMNNVTQVATFNQTGIASKIIELRTVHGRCAETATFTL